MTGKAIKKLPIGKNDEGLGLVASWFSRSVNAMLRLRVKPEVIPFRDLACPKVRGGTAATRQDLQRFRTRGARLGWDEGLLQEAKCTPPRNY